MFYSLSDPFLYVNFFYFLLSIFLAFFVPGDVLLKNQKLRVFERIILSTLFGLALFVFQGFIFGYLNIRFFSYIYILLFFSIWIYRKNYLDLNIFEKIQINLRNSIFFILIFLGTTLQVSAMWFTGIKDANGIFLCCGNALDSLFHAALTHQIIKDIPPLQPGMYPVQVTNYHYLSNLIIADLVRIFNLPLIPTLFQYMTIFISLFLGLAAVAFSRIEKMSTMFTAWLLFFLYFGGDFIYLALILAGNPPTFRMGALEHGGIFLVNPPRAYAIVLFFGFLSLFSLWVKSRNMYIGILYGLVAATLVGLKVYVGIFVLFGLGVLSLYFLINKKFSYMIPIIIAVMGSLLFYLPVNRAAGGLYYTGFWLFENFIVQSEFNLGRMELARNVYKDHGNILRVIQYEAMYIAFYIFAIFGTKIVGFFQTKKSLSLLPKEIHILLLSGIGISIILGFFFQQESGGANSFNFIVSIFIIGSIYSALALTYWLNRVSRVVAVFLSLLIILFTIPRATNQLWFNLESIIAKNGNYISNEHYQVGLELNKRTDKESLILIDPQFSDSDDHSPYFSIISDRNMFLSGRGILESHNIPTSERKNTRDTILKTSNRKKIAELLQKNYISHIIVPSSKDLFYSDIEKYSNVLFENNVGKIIEIVPEELDIYINEKQYEEILEK